MTRRKKASRSAPTGSAPARSTPELIVHKRGGGELGAAEIRSLIDGYVTGDVADYQMAAFAMAVYFQGMSPAETAALTLAMRDSGQVLDLAHVEGAKVDKHSTGGVGDKVSICLAPMVAACGVRVPMVSGRGLGHTGGTLDKLEAIAGFRVDLSVKQFVSLVAKNGCALAGQTADLAPADKRFYALRDVTGTVESIPLITASILSKKLAEGIDALVLDVKVGSGAFMKTLEDARALARSIVRVGRLADKKVTAVLSAMDQPLGLAVGNALETREALDVLHGGGPEDLIEITLALGSEMLVMGRAARSHAEARARLRRTIDDGSALATMRRIVRSQKGDVRMVDEPDRLPSAPTRVALKTDRDGHVRGLDALEIGLSSGALGAGRTRADQDIDPAVGIVLERKVGDRVVKGDTLAVLHARDRSTANRVKARVLGAYTIGRGKPKPAPLVLETIRR